MHHGLKLGEIFAAGGQGVVCAATQLATRREVAVKRRALPGERDDFLSRSETSLSVPAREGTGAEATFAAHLQHPCIPSVYEIAHDDLHGELIVMMRVDGEVWEEKILREITLHDRDEYLAVHVGVLLRVAEAVAYAHACGLVHRDLHPGQVKVGEFGRVWLFDWGFSAIYDPEAAAEWLGFDPAGLPTTNAHSGGGRESFKAPEQREKRPTGPWTDVYLLGGLLYFILTGTPPHALDPKTVQVVTLASPDLTHPESLVSLAMRSLSTGIGERPASAVAFAEELRGYLSGRSGRERSHMLLEEARAGRQASTTPEACLALHQLLESARGYWPENPDLDAESDAVREKTARLALAHRDLALAHREALLIRAETVRGDLLQAVKRLKTIRTIGRRAFILVSCGALVLSVMLALQWKRALRARMETQSAYELADQSRVFAIQLLGATVLDVYAGFGLDPTLLAANDELEASARERVSATPEMHMRDIGKRCFQAGLLVESEAFMKSAIARFATLGDSGEANADTTSYLSNSYSWLGRIKLRSGDVAGARDAHLHALECARRDVAAFPEIPRKNRGVVSELWRLARIDLEEGDLDAALDHAREAEDIALKLMDMGLESGHWRADLAASLQLQSDAHREKGELDTARKLQERMLKLWLDEISEDTSRSGKERPGPQTEFGYATTLVSLGEVEMDLGNETQAQQRWQEALPILQRLARGNWEPVHREAEARLLMLLDRNDDARPILEELKRQNWGGDSFQKQLQQVSRP